MLRKARRDAGISLDVLAARSNFSKPYLSNVEAGRRRVTRELAAAYDAVLGLGDLLTRLATGDADLLIGRSAEVARLRRLVADLAAGRGRALWIQGEPGIGKSTLLRAGLADVTRSGCRVFCATADESLVRFPLWVMLDCLGVGAAHDDPERREISAMLRGDGASGLPPGDAVMAAAERLLQLVERCTEESPVVLAIDDLQWADEVSLSVWGRLRRLVRQVPLLLVGSCRPVPRRPEVAALRRGMTGPESELFDLAPLDAAETGEVIGRLTGSPPGPRLARVAAQAGGNPLYLRELLDALLREQRIQVTAETAELAGDDAVPGSLAAAIANRLGFLSEPTRRVLRIAALLGPAPAVADLRVVTGQPATELATSVDEAMAAGVLTSSATGLAFRHGLIRRALSAEIPPGLRSELHRQAAQAMAGEGAPVERVANQLLAGRRYTDEWIPGWLAAGNASTLTYRAPEAADELLAAVLARLPADNPYRDELTACRLTALYLLGRHQDVVRLGMPALDTATDPDVLGRMAWTLAYAKARLGRIPEGLDLVTRIAPDSGTVRVPEPWLSRLRAFGATALMAVGRHEEAWAIAERILARPDGDTLASAYALHMMSVSSRRSDDEARSIGYIEQALSILEDRPETADLRCLLLGNRMMALHNLGRLGDLDRAVAEAVAAAERAGALSRLNAVRSQVANLYLQLGRWDDACAEVAAVAELVGDDPVQAVWCRATGALIAVHRDDRAALREHLDAVRDIDLDAPEVRYIGRWMTSAVALADELDGHPDRALDRFLATCFEPGSPDGAPTLDENCTLWLPEVVRLALGAGRRGVATTIARATAVRADTDHRLRSAAVSRHCAGLLAADPALLDAAAGEYARGGFQLYRAHALEDRAVLLAQRGELERARIAYRDAVDTYTALDAAWDLRRAASRLRRYGLRQRAYRRRPATGWDALTPTELKVAALIAEGRANRDIAAQLLVSRRTVETHVAHILAKLDAHSRHQVAALFNGRDD